MAYKIGEFVLESKLGAGGMGVVFRARQVSLQRWVALKLLSRNASAGSNFIERFYREARATAQLVHPNIIQTYTIGEHKGAPYFAMEYVEGKDLATLLASGEPLEVGECIEVVRSVAKALSVAFEHSIVHRDIKPANIMVSKSGIVKVMDFGLAKATSIDESLTQDGQIIGTPTYMSPEQGSGNNVDTRSDLYSLGCVFYEVLTGRPPFLADNVPALVFKQLYEKPEAPSKLNQNVSAELEAICLKLMEKNPADRYQDPLELISALAAIETNTSKAELALAQRAKKAPPREEPGPIANLPSSTEEDETKRRSSETASMLAAVPTQPEAAVRRSAETVRTSAQPSAQPEGSERRNFASGGTLIEARPERSSLEPGSLTTDGALIEPASAHPETKGTVKSVAPPTKRIARPQRPEEYEANVPDPSQLAEPTPTPFVPEKPVIDRMRQSSRYMPTLIESLPDTKQTTSKAKPDAISALPPKANLEKPKKIVPPPPRHTHNTSRMKLMDGAGPAKPRATTQRLSSAFALEKVEGVSPFFKKHPSGRWCYDTSLPHCRHSEGLAAEPLPGQHLSVGTYGDCLACSNWSRRPGCAIATTQDIASKSRARGADLTEELALVWCAAKRFDRAIALIENHIKEFPNDAGGYKVLARVYERPDYPGEDRKRAIVLYSRFLELAEVQGGCTALEIQRTRDRLSALQSGQFKVNPDTGPFSSTPLPNAIETFRCFYRWDKTAYFGLSAITRSHLRVARVGDVDPDTGVPASEVGGRFQRASRFFRRIKSAGARMAEREAARKEFRRLAGLTVDTLVKEAQMGTTIELSEIDAVAYTPVEEPDSQEGGGFHCVQVRVLKHTHDFFFSPLAELEAERCAVILKRLSGK